MVAAEHPSEVYQGQFGEFTITRGDRLGVVAYRIFLLVAALCFAAGVGIVLAGADMAAMMVPLHVLYWGFAIALGGSLLLIHIYLVPLHRTLQLFWLIGVVAAAAISLSYSEPLLVTLYHYPMTILGVGFMFAALTGIFFKEAFCFGRLETKLLTPLVPILLLSHLFNLMPLSLEKGLLGAWAVLMLVFALRKVVQAIPPDIGDKSVFAYLKNQGAVSAL